MTDDDPIDTLVERLLRLRVVLGTAAYENAVLCAMVAVGRAAMSEAERRAGTRGPAPAGVVVRFPAGGRGGPRGES